MISETNQKAFDADKAKAFSEKLLTLGLPNEMCNNFERFLNLRCIYEI